MDVTFVLFGIFFNFIRFLWGIFYKCIPAFVCRIFIELYHISLRCNSSFLSMKGAKLDFVVSLRFLVSRMSYIFTPNFLKYEKNITSHSLFIASELVFMILKKWENYGAQKTRKNWFYTLGSRFLAGTHSLRISKTQSRRGRISTCIENTKTRLYKQSSHSQNGFYFRRVFAVTYE